MSEEKSIENNPIDKEKELEKVERAIESAYSTGKADWATVTQSAHKDTEEALSQVEVAMKADEEADDAMKIAVIAEKSGDRQKARTARKKEREARRKANKEHAAATRSARKAYNAIRFSAPNKLGFMRFIQVMFVFHIIVNLLVLMLLSRDAYVMAGFNSTSFVDWTLIIFSGVTFWLIINRYKIARPVAIGMQIFDMATHAIMSLAVGQFNLPVFIESYFFDIVVLLYFIFSDRVKMILINDIGKGQGEFEKEDFRIKRFSWPFIRNLIIYFIVFSVLGHWMEMGLCQFIRLGLVQGDYNPTNTMLWRDWLYPFPMEGAAVVVIALVLYPFFIWLKKKYHGKKVVIAYLISFVSGALLCSVIEFSMGLIVNADYQLWDYRENFGNLMGQICLQNTMAFGVVAAIITWWVYPLLERWLSKVPRDIMNLAAVIIFVFGAIIWSLYIIAPPQDVEKRIEERMQPTKSAAIVRSIHDIGYPC